MINTEASLYIESPELAQRLMAYMATGVVPANSYRVLLDPDEGIIWETVADGQAVRYRNEPGTGFRRRFVVDLLKLLPQIGISGRLRWNPQVSRCPRTHRVGTNQTKRIAFTTAVELDASLHAGDIQFGLTVKRPPCGAGATLSSTTGWSRTTAASKAETDRCAGSNVPSQHEMEIKA